MMLIKTTLYTLFCMIAGGAISAGYVAFITLLGVFEKLAEKYKAYQHGRLLESVIIAGVTTGNVIQLLDIRLFLGIPGVFFFNLFGGIFIGCLAGALAETLDIFPILSRRFGIRDYLPYAIIAAAFGKAAGCMVQLLLF